MISRRKVLTEVVPASLLVGVAVAAIQCAPQVSSVAGEEPLLDLINRYKAEEDRYNTASHATDEEADADLEAVNVLLYELRDWTSSATTKAGAIAALRLTRDFIQHSIGGYENAMIAAALGFLEKDEPA